MKMKKIQITLIALIIFALVACEPNISNPQGTKKLGTLSTKDNASLVYVAIGTSVSAGCQSYAVFGEASKYCFPNILATQMGVPFVQPQYGDNGIDGGLRYMLKGFTSAGLPKIYIQQESGSILNSSYAKPYNNLAVWGAVAYDLIDTSDFALRGQARQNPYYVPVLRSKTYGSSMVAQAIAQQPDVITFEMGANDVLGYAKSGGTISTAKDANGNYIPTPVAAMQQIFGGALQALTTALPNTKIILFTVPNVLGVPFFRTVPWNALLINQGQADTLTMAYSQLGFKFHAGANGFVAQSPLSPYKMRQLDSTDYLLLTVPTDSLAAGWGSKKPIPNEYVLDKLEAAIVSKAVSDYNTMIRGLKAMSTNIYIFDLDQVLTNLITSNTAVPGSTPMNSKFISGEAFSMDGFHPTSRGQGVIANELIKFLNTTFGSDIPQVAISTLPANYINP